MGDCWPDAFEFALASPNPTEADLYRTHGAGYYGALAANVVARAVARGVFEATALPFPGAVPSWKDRFGR